MKTSLKLMAASSLFALAAGSAAAQTELRMMWYNDGIEGEVMQSILDRFEEAHPDISVTLDVVPYQAVLESLPIQLAAGNGPSHKALCEQYRLPKRPQGEGGNG